MEKVLADTNIILDLLAKREPFYDPAANLFSRADRGELIICVSALSFANVNYLLSRQFTASLARGILLKFRTLVEVLSINDRIVDLALSCDFRDFEDGIQYFTAIENAIPTIITRNLKDFKHAAIPVMTAEQFLNAV
jgi:predicted nucleic acid-binding protein